MWILFCERSRGNVCKALIMKFENLLFLSASRPRSLQECDQWHWWNCGTTKIKWTTYPCRNSARDHKQDILWPTRDSGIPVFLAQAPESTCSNEALPSCRTCWLVEVAADFTFCKMASHLEVCFQRKALDFFGPTLLIIINSRHLLLCNCKPLVGFTRETPSGSIT